MGHHAFDEVMKGLPEGDTGFAGVQTWNMDAPDHQVVFFKAVGDVEVPEHSHSCKQWGVVLEGEMQLTVDGKTTQYKKGDSYYIPPDAPHSGRAKAGGFAIDFFDTPGRHKTLPRRP